MNKDFEKEYKKLIEEDPPELWDRIEKMVDAAIAEGASADTEEKSEEETELAAAVTEILEGKPEESGEEKAENETGDEDEGADTEDSEKKTVILGAFGEAAAEKEADGQEDGGKKKKVFNWRRWVLPAAALLCVAIMIPVVITILGDKSKKDAAMKSNSATAQSDSVASAGADAEMNEMPQAAAETDNAAGESVEDRRGLAPDNNYKVEVKPSTDGEYEIVLEEAESGEDESNPEEAGEEEDDEEDEEEWDEEEWDEDEDEEDEEELVKALICISIDEDTPASVIDEIASQFGLSNLGYDEEFDEYHLAVPEAMTEDALDELIDAIAENENVWCVYWDYADE